jgi:hypothetical protein
VVPADRHARTDQRESPDKIEPALAAEPIENTEATEPTEPIERIEPAEPMDKIEPAEPMDKIDPLDPMLSSEPAEPLERGEPSAVCMRAFSQPSPISGRRARSSWATTWWTASTGCSCRKPHPCWWELMHGWDRCCARWRRAGRSCEGGLLWHGDRLLLRMAYIGVMNVFALLGLLPMSSQDKDAALSSAGSGCLR